MNILPRLAYLMSSIPLKFSPSWFKEVNKLFSCFLWRDKKPRISYKKLTNPRVKGGIGLPDIHQYYVAYNSRYPLHWAYNKVREVGGWDWLEEQILKEYNTDLSLPVLWYNPKAIPKMKNPLLQFSCEIKLLQKHLSFSGTSLPLCPLWSNSLFTARGQNS